MPDRLPIYRGQISPIRLSLSCVNGSDIQDMHHFNGQITATLSSLSRVNESVPSCNQGSLTQITRDDLVSIITLKQLREIQSAEKKELKRLHEEEEKAYRIANKLTL